jgi:hypothetical protein
MLRLQRGIGDEKVLRAANAAERRGRRNGPFRHHSLFGIYGYRFQICVAGCVGDNRAWLGVANGMLPDLPRHRFETVPIGKRLFLNGLLRAELLCSPSSDGCADERRREKFLFEAAVASAKKMSVKRGLGSRQVIWNGL